MKNYIVYIACITFIVVFGIWSLIKRLHGPPRLTMKRPGRIIISMTTTPHRIHKIDKVIRNMEKQTLQPDLYFINLPIVFKRDGSKFNSIPPFLINDRIILNFCEDLGPATKIVPTCKNKGILDSDIIFSIDDDIYYPPALLELYLKYHIAYPNYVITGTTLFDKKNARRFGDLLECELLEGFSCVLYKKFWLKDIPERLFDKSSVPIYHYLSDDLVLSNYLTMIGIGILTLPRGHRLTRQIKPFDYGLQEDALHKGAGGLAPSCKEGEHCNFTNYIETIRFLKKNGLYFLEYSEEDIKRH